MLTKTRKTFQYVGAFQNWFTCLRLRQAVGRSGHVNGDTAVRRVRLRNGLQMNARVGSPDISIIWEVMAGGAYASTEELIHAAGPRASVVDLGANIGAFTLRCANFPASACDVEVHSYEPGPQNAVVLRANLELNPAAAAHVRFYQEAAAEKTGTAFWHFDSDNPGGSSLGGEAGGLAVTTTSFRDVLARCTRPIAFVKVDIEGSEYGLVDGTEKADWEAVPAVLCELHADPAGKSNDEQWLARMRDFGFRQQVREFSSLCLRR